MVGYVKRGRMLSALSSFIFMNITPTDLVARAGGGKANATLAGSALNRVTTAATAADSVLLKTPRAGDALYLFNETANAVQVFGAGTTTIDGVATGTGVSLPAGKRALFVSFEDAKYLMTVLN